MEWWGWGREGLERRRGDGGRAVGGWRRKDEKGTDDDEGSMTTRVVKLFTIHREGIEGAWAVLGET